MTLLTFKRISSAPPPEREVLEIESDGTFALWRSIAARVGRFGGRVPNLAAIERAAAAVAATNPPDTGALQPDAGVETVTVAAGSVRIEAGSDPGGPWGELVTACRELLDELQDQPRAAVGMTVDIDREGIRVALAHLGDVPLTLFLAAGRLDVTAWRDARVVGSTAVGFAAGQVEARPGWAIESLVPPPSLEAGDRVEAEATFVVDDGGIFVPVMLGATTVVPPSRGAAG